jgi:hypothetical protein
MSMNYGERELRCMNEIMMFHNSLIINGKKYSKIFCDIPNNPYLCVLKLKKWKR